MAKLKTKHKEFIVKQLACFNTLTDVRNQLQDIHNVDVPLNQIIYYDPESAQGTTAKKLVHIFNETRDEYIQECSKIPIFHKGYRLRELQKNYNKAITSKNIVLANQILEQAAKEAGGAYEAKMMMPEVGENGTTFIQQINQKIEQNIINNTHKS